MGTRRPPRLTVVAAIGTSLALALAACGGDDATDEEPADDEAVDDEAGDDEAADDEAAEEEAAEDDSEDEATGGRLTVATGNTTGVYFILGGGIAQLITSELDGYRATAESTSASRDNIERLVSGQNEIGFSLADTAADAVLGQESFDDPQPVQALARIYENTTQVIVQADSGVTSVEDLAGLSVSTGSPNSGTELIATRLLGVNGLTTGDINQLSLSLGETVDGMKDGSIDAMFWSGGLPTAGVTDLFTTAGEDVVFLDLSGDVAALQETYGAAYQPGTIPADAYGTGQDVPTVTVPNVLMVNENMSEDLAGDLVRLIFEFQDDLVAVHPEAENITLDKAIDTGDITLHPGAEAALVELGATAP